jgi:hypothetical protein
MEIDGISNASIETFERDSDEGDLRLVAHSKGAWVSQSSGLI